MTRKPLFGLSVLLVATALVLLPDVPLSARTVTDCPAADPFDNDPDTDALNTCLDEYDVVQLEPSDQGGYVGYIINWVETGDCGFAWGPNGCGSGVVVGAGNTIEPGDEGAKPILIAHPELKAPLISTSHSANGFELHQIIVDGNRENRTNACDVGGTPDECSNIVIKADSFEVVGVESWNTLAGTGMGVEGEQFLITGSGFYWNGAEEGSGPVSDGLTLAVCIDSEVSGNSFANNSDVSLVLFENGNNCRIAHNNITQDGRYGLAGVGVSQNPNGEVVDNEVDALEDGLGYGIILGDHPWNASQNFGDAGEIYENTINGAVINLGICGIDDADVHDNSFSNHQGTRGLNSCTVSADYTVGHAGSASLQGGYTSLINDAGTACYTPAPAPLATASFRRSRESRTGPARMWQLLTTAAVSYPMERSGKLR
jgi:hypothetical protein